MSTGIAIGGAISGYMGSRSSSKAAKRERKRQAALDAENKRVYIQERDETIRRTEGEQDKVVAQGNVATAASGFAGGSSLDRYMENMQAEHASDINWMQTSGANVENLMAMESAARQSQMKESERASKFSGIGSAISGVGQAWGSYNKVGWGW